MASLLLQERFDLDAGLLEDGAEGAFGHVAGMVRDGGVAIAFGVEPDFVRAGGLAVKLQTQFFSRLMMSR